MFTSVDRVERKILEVIYDDADDDLVFLIAQKSTGKTEVLNRLEVLLSKDGVLFATGESIKTRSNSVVKRAFVEGILKYCDKCDEGRQNLLEELQLRGVVTQNLYENNTRLGTVLCTMSAEDLKTIYSIISYSTPLVLLLPPCPRIKDEDLRFFSELDDLLIEFKPRVTYVVATRSNPTNVERIREIVQSKGKGVWLFPVFCAEQMIDGQIPNTDSNWNILESISKAYGKAWTATYLQLLANSEITKEDYDCVADAISVLGICQPEGYSEKLVLYNNGVYSWIDASSYSAAPKAFENAAYNDSQNLFFRIVECINQKIGKEARTSTEKFAIRNARNAIVRFLKIIANNKPNCILEDFSEYYKGLSNLVRLIFSINRDRVLKFEEIVNAIEVLFRHEILFSKEKLIFLEGIYTETQICSILEVGLTAIDIAVQKFNFFDECKKNGGILEQKLTDYVGTCIANAIKWHDMGLARAVESTLVLMRDRVTVKYSSIARNAGICATIDPEIWRIVRNTQGVLMPSVFLSYSKVNNMIADEIDSELCKLGYEVKRYTRDVEDWESFDCFMGTIRTTDFVVCIVSDTFLRRDYCMYEVCLAVEGGDSSKVIPVVIDFSKNEVNTRKKIGKTTDFFCRDYLAEIGIFWDGEVEKWKDDITNAKSEELCSKLQKKIPMLKRIAEVAHDFMESIIDSKVACIDPKKKSKKRQRRNENPYKKIVDRIDGRIIKCFDRHR